MHFLHLKTYVFMQLEKITCDMPCSAVICYEINLKSSITQNTQVYLWKPECVCISINLERKLRASVF